MAVLTRTKNKIMKNAKGYTRKQLDAVIDAYLLDATISSDTLKNEYDITATTEKERVNFVMSEFDRCANFPHNIQKFPNEIYRFADYLQGLPSVLNTDFENYRIIEIAKEWGSLPANATSKQEDVVIENWFNYIANKFFRLHAKLNKDPKTKKG